MLEMLRGIYLKVRMVTREFNECRALQYTFQINGRHPGSMTRNFKVSKSYMHMGHFFRFPLRKFSLKLFFCIFKQKKDIYFF